MAIKDYLPSGKTVASVVGGVVLGAGAAVVLNPVPDCPVFVPSKETCSNYFETRNGRFICVIAGQKTADPIGVEVPEQEQLDGFVKFIGEIEGSLKEVLKDIRS